MKISQRFIEITGKTHLYNIQAIDNIASIIQLGLLSYDKAKKVSHVSVAMQSVQERRDSVSVPNGMKLHEYASLYFDFWNPMLSSKRDQNENICILRFDVTLLDLDGVVISDRNASSAYVAFYDAQTGLDNIDFKMVYARYWTDDDFFMTYRKKSAKCAEILVPMCIPYIYLTDAVVLNQTGELRLIEAGFNKRIIIDPSYFFQ